MIEAAIRDRRRGIDFFVPGPHRSEEDLAPPSFKSMRSLPCCMDRLTSAPSIFTNHCAIAFGIGRAQVNVVPVLSWRFEYWP